MSSKSQKLPRLSSDFTFPECEYFRRMCNFTPEERKIFDMRVADKSIVQISMEMGMCESAVYRRTRKIREKIAKVF